MFEFPSQIYRIEMLTSLVFQFNEFFLFNFVCAFMEEGHHSYGFSWNVMNGEDILDYFHNMFKHYRTL